MKNREEIVKEFKGLKNDIERFRYVIDHPEYNIKIMLDNDDTFGVFDDEEDWENILQFNDYLGWSDGIFSLLKALNVKHDGV